MVRIKPDRLTVSLGWYGRVLDGPLKQRAKAGEACWSLDKTTVNLNSVRFKPTAPATAAAAAASSSSNNPQGAGSSSTAAAGGGGGSDGTGGKSAEFVELMVLLPKEGGGHYWRALFEGGQEKSHLEVGGVVCSEAEVVCMWYLPLHCDLHLGCCSAQELIGCRAFAIPSAPSCKNPV